MTRTSLDDALWASLMLTMQQIPHAWKRDEAALWVCRTGAPWRDLPDDLGHWPSVHHRFRRWSVRGWWELVFEAQHPAPPADAGLFNALVPPL
jgi:transposase